MDLISQFRIARPTHTKKRSGYAKLVRGWIKEATGESKIPPICNLINSVIGSHKKTAVFNVAVSMDELKFEITVYTCIMHVQVPPVKPVVSEDTIA